MTYTLKSYLLATAVVSACVPAIAHAQSSTSPGTPTNAPTGQCDLAADPNCKPNQNQKEQSDTTVNPNGGDVLNKPANGAQDPAATNNDQTPGSMGNSNSTSGGSSVAPSGSGNVEGDNAGGAGSAGGSGASN